MAIAASMRGLVLASLAISTILFAIPHLIAGQTTSPAPSDETDVPRGASDDSGVFNPIWIVVVAVGFVALVFTGMLWRKRQRPGNR